jgi:hypothetical protein
MSAQIEAVLVDFWVCARGCSDGRRKIGPSALEAELGK